MTDPGHILVQFAEGKLSLLEALESVAECAPRLADHEHDWRRSRGRAPSYRLDARKHYLTPVVCAICPATAYADNDIEDKELLPPWRGPVVDIKEPEPIDEAVRRHPSNADFYKLIEPASLEIVHSQKNGYRAKARDENGMTMGYCCSEGHKYWAQANEHLKEKTADQLIRIAEVESEAASV